MPDPRALQADPEAPLAELDDDQRAAATALRGPVAILAGAGSGKTRVITHRIAYGVATGVHEPQRSVAVTFTTKAAGEMGRRLRGLGVPDVRVSTFHSAALRQLRFYWPRHSGRELPEVMAAKAPMVGAAASLARVPTDAATVRDLSGEIEWAKVRSLPPADYPAAAVAFGRELPAGLSPERMGAIFADYERRKDAAGRIDFEDVLLLMVALIDSQPKVAAHLRSGLAHITVDEYQDASPLQQRLLDGWLGANTNLCVVGDPAQTIYSFAGADATLLTRFADRYPDATVLRLPRTYRCTPEIAGAANRVLAAAREGVALKSQRDPGPAVRVMAYDHEQAEADGVADRIAELIADGMPPSEIAVLVRMNAMTEPVEEALAERRIPYRVAGGGGFFNRPEVRRAISVIRGGAVSAGGDQAGSAEGGGAGQAGAVVADTVAAILSGLGWTPEPPVGAGAVRESWESLSALHTAAEAFASRHPAGSLREFAEELKQRAERQDVPESAGVTLSSLHSAKGMEWQAVFLVGLVEGVVPHSSAKTDEELAEERRLLYVGITRAKDHLQLSYARARSMGGRVRRPSRFLITLDAAGARTAASVASKPRSARRTAAHCRLCGKALTTGAERSLGRCRACPSDVDLELLEALRQWRTAVVEEQSADRDKKLPAYVIATDATLQALAEQRPSSADALAAIPGIGPRKLDDYGADLLAIIGGHTAGHSVAHSTSAADPAQD